MNVAITGANGYIGRYVQSLFQKDKNMQLMLLTIDDETAPYKRIDYSKESLLEAFGEVEVVIHLAAIRNVRSYDDMEKNISLTDRVAEAAGQAGVHKIVYASSISVYSNEELIPWQEGSCENPTTLYGVSKLAAEHLIRIHASKYGMKYTNLRFAHVIGDNMPGSYMIPTFFRNATEGLPLEVTGKSVAKRELIDVIDIARAIYWAVCNSDSDDQTINTGTGCGMTNLDIARVISFNTDVELKYDDSKNEGIVSSVMNVEKARKLGFKALRTPEESIKRILADRNKTIEEILL